jgi:hypothetical protein
MPLRLPKHFAGFAALASLFATHSLAADNSSVADSIRHETIVQRQLDAYSAKDIAALMAIYAEDAQQQQFEHPSKLLAACF